MAVQTAIMNPQFMNFCFSGSVVEYDVEKSLDGGLLGEAENDEDYKETTRDLLSFIDSASSNIKLALDKPVKSKRKVNHRKYLQKQIKRCTGIITPGNTAEAPVKRQGSPLAQPSPLQSKTLPKRDGVQANLQSKSLAALFSPVKDIRGEKAKKPPLRHRNLPPSFFTEPANCSKVSSTSGMTLKDFERGNPEAAEFFELLGPDYSNLVSDQDLYQNMPLRVQPEMGGLDPATYDSHHLVGGLLYSEPWTSCSGPSKKAGESLRTGPAQPPLYCQSEAATTGPLEDNALCTLAFPNFFTDCPIPQVTYDLSGGYNRANYSSL
ncbi:protein FAM181B [Paralichthys olivaceus]|uniref:protein FAM181B n=1 Tax=Paralichthys olivaceus TaxID=8255 RepID=UPI00097DB4BF|nr:PREDICTED: protein FAM181B [Paralichthys olivaceus]